MRSSILVLVASLVATVIGVAIPNQQCMFVLLLAGGERRSYVFALNLTREFCIYFTANASLNCVSDKLRHRCLPPPLKPLKLRDLQKWMHMQLCAC
ncbi:BQ5605_C004g02841 [Microbotryum silenes-dioicae]|uniref:BQ5605_C004g02841 protein n=1 Tax=Microbotryum silenes-dioicae TaxID=796604 RepID=A0A2X0P4H8_9BASI|nr:BQ5605_C004g02841 [Microbotryum silenes-dioicae]